MTTAVQTVPEKPDVPLAGDTPGKDAGAIPESWSELRADPDIQFEDIALSPEPVEPGWFAEALTQLFGFFAKLFSPIGQLLGAAWPVLQWVLLAAAAAFVIYLALRTFMPMARRGGTGGTISTEPEWQPDREESIALLEDADRLAAEGRFDEATHLLLKRSVSQIAAARPDWVEPSSTARELAALPALSDAARSAFATISDRVERSLFALRSLERGDWEAARSAYAAFALARLETSGSGDTA